MLLKFFSVRWFIHNVATMYWFSPDVPDYSNQITQANKDTAEAAKADLDFRRQQYADAQPRLNALYDMANKVGTQQYDSSVASDKRAAEQNQFWTDNYKPTELRSLQEANDAGGEADQNRVAGKAIADQRSQQAIASAATNRAMLATGVNPNSGKFVGLNNAMSLQGAASSAGAATGAREQAKNQGIALRAGAVATGRGMQNMAGQTAATALNQGNSATTNANTGAQGGLGYGNFVGTGYGNVTNANSTIGSGWMGLQNTSNQLNAQDSGFGSLLGTLGGAAITKYSDARLKENIEFEGEENGHEVYSFNYIGGKGLPEGRFIGVMAQNVMATNPDAVVIGEDGYLSVDYAKIGIEMRAL